MRYVLDRQGHGLSNGTINRELSVLTRALRHAYEANKLRRLPRIHKLKEAGARQGFIERDQYEGVSRRLAPDLQVAVAIGYQLGWRRDEVLSLTWKQVDLEVGALWLEPDTTKNDDGRVAYCTPELARLLTEQFERVQDPQRRLGIICPYDFPHLAGGQRAGRRRSDFVKQWKAATTAAGVLGMLKHDLRRTAVRNMERAGVPRSVAMKITGHKTESMYRRYAIVSDADLQAAAQRMAGTLPGVPGITAGITAGGRLHRVE